MNFKNLEKRIQDVIKTFPADKEFNEALNTDKILDNLDLEETHRENDYDEFLMLTEGKFFVNGKKYHAMTVKNWVYLFILKSPLIQQTDKKPTSLDFDIMFNIVENGVEDINAIESLGSCKSAGLSDDEIIDWYEKQMNLAFTPMLMFPHNIEEAGEKIVCKDPVFDCDWLTSMITRVHSVTGMSPSEIINLPLNTCCYYFVQFARVNGTKNIDRKSPEEISIAKLERTTEIIVDTLIKKGVIKLEERQEYIEKINEK